MVNDWLIEQMLNNTFTLLFTALLSVFLFFVGLIRYRQKIAKDVIHVWLTPSGRPKNLLRYFRRFVKPSFVILKQDMAESAPLSYKELNKRISATTGYNPIIIICAPAGMGKTRLCQQLLLLHRKKLKKSAQYYKKSDEEIISHCGCIILRKIESKQKLWSIIDACDDRANTTLLLDGFDELPFLDGDENTSNKVLDEWLEYLRHEGGDFRKIIITMRVESFSAASTLLTDLKIVNTKPEMATILNLESCTSDT